MSSISLAFANQVINAINDYATKNRKKIDGNIDKIRDQITTIATIIYANFGIDKDTIKEHIIAWQTHKSSKLFELTDKKNSDQKSIFIVEETVNPDVAILKDYIRWEQLKIVNSFFFANSLSTKLNELLDGKRPDFFAQVPAPVTAEILKSLSLQDLMNTNLVSKKFHNVTNNVLLDSFLREGFKNNDKTFHQIILEKPEAVTIWYTYGKPRVLPGSWGERDDYFIPEYPSLGADDIKKMLKVTNKIPIFTSKQLAYCAASAPHTSYDDRYLYSIFTLDIDKNAKLEAPKANKSKSDDEIKTYFVGKNNATLFSGEIYLSEKYKRHIFNLPLSTPEFESEPEPKKPLQLKRK